MKNFASHNRLVASFCMRAIMVVMISMSALNISAQQEWNYSQYLFNLYDINSAYAGNHNTMSFALRHRSQWIGLEGSPSTQQFSLHTPMMNGKLGVGLKMNMDQIGARTQQSGRLSVAYRLKLASGTLSMGVAGGVIRQSIDRNKLHSADEQDVVLQGLNSPAITPVADFSVFYSTKKFYAGVDCGRINRSPFGFSENSIARLYYNASLVAGYMKRVGDDNMIQLSGLYKYSEGKLWQAELNLLYLYRNKAWFGAGYRLQCCFQVFACANISEHFRLGLSYDLADGEMRSSNDGSAEIFLGYTLKNRSGKSVRYF